jgi:hypothetical protein
LLVAAAGASAEPRVLSVGADVAPALAGDTVLWVDPRPGSDGVIAADAGGVPRQILARAGGTYLSDLSASDGRAAVLVEGPDGKPGAVWTSDLRGFTRLYGDDYQARGCWQSATDVDGSHLAYAAVNCDDGGITVLDLSGASEPVRIAAQPVPNGQASRTRVRVAGRYVAWNEFSFTQAGRPHWLVLYDWVQKREVTRINVSALVGGNPSYAPSSWVDFDLGPDGTLVFVAGDIPDHRVTHFSWLSAADPEPHAIPVRVWGGPLALAGNLVAVHRREPDDLAVVDLSGRVVDVFERERVEGAQIAFNGRRLAWNGAEHFGEGNNSRLPLAALVTERFPRPPAGLPDVVDGLTVSPRRLTAPRRAHSSARRRVARVRYTLLRPARATVRVERALRGRRTRSGCRKAARRVARRHRCIRWKRVTGLPAAEELGPVTRRLPVRAGRRPLSVGRYRLTVLSRLSRGSPARPERTGFRVLRR